MSIILLFFSEKKITLKKKKLSVNSRSKNVFALTVFSLLINEKLLNYMRYLEKSKRN
jgi:hypothetical protein